MHAACTPPFHKARSVAAVVTVIQRMFGRRAPTIVRCGWHVHRMNGRKLKGEMHPHVQKLFTHFERKGENMYEQVSQLAHALQSARLAQLEDGRPNMIVAALFHDIGHLLVPGDDPASDQCLKKDFKHEFVGSRYLATFFGDAVTNPVALHVDAKRYLAAMDKTGKYVSSLSKSSTISLKLQGGPFSQAEAKDFEAIPYYKDALRLRSWDDRAKVLGLDVPPLSHYAPVVEDCLRLLPRGSK